MKTEITIEQARARRKHFGSADSIAPVSTLSYTNVATAPNEEVRLKATTFLKGTQSDTESIEEYVTTEALR